MTNCVKRLLPLALAAALAGCAMQATDSNAARYQVALVAKSKDSEFWNAVFTGAEAAATEYNMQLTIAAPNSEEDYEEQDRRIEKAVEDGAQAIVFSAIDYEKNAAAIDAAAAAGVTIIGIDSAVDSAHVAAYIGADNYGAGQMAAQSALDGMDGQLYVGLINYEVNGANGRDREQGARDAFADSGRAEVVAAMPTHSIAVSARSEHPREAVIFLNAVNTDPEIRNLLNFGIQGVHYELTEAGQVRSISDGYQGVSYTQGNWFILRTRQGESPDRWQTFEKFNNAAQESAILGFMPDYSAHPDIVEEVTRIYGKYYSALITGTVDPDTYVPQMLDELQSAGLNTLRQDLQSQLDNWLVG